MNRFKYLVASIVSILILSVPVSGAIVTLSDMTAVTLNAMTENDVMYMINDGNSRRLTTNTLVEWLSTQGLVTDNYKSNVAISGTGSFGGDGTFSSGFLDIGDLGYTSDQVSQLDIIGRKANANGEYASLRFQQCTATGGKYAEIVAERTNGSNFAATLVWKTTDGSGNIGEQMRLSSSDGLDVSNNFSATGTGSFGGDIIAPATTGSSMYTFTGDTDTGLGRQADGTTAIFGNGTEILRTNTAGSAFYSNLYAGGTFEATGTGSFGGDITVQKVTPVVNIRSSALTAGLQQYIVFGDYNYNRALIEQTNTNTAEGALSYKIANDAGSLNAYMTVNGATATVTFPNATTFAGTGSFGGALTAGGLTAHTTGFTTAVISSTRSNNIQGIGGLYFNGYNGASEETRYTRIDGIIIDNTDGAEIGRMDFYNKVSGTDTAWLSGSGTSATFLGAVNLGTGVVFPTSDPGVAGQWWDNAGTLTKSSG